MNKHFYETNDEYLIFLERAIRVVTTTISVK
jgi:hypothetical protein